jgi:hypothetical protein
LSPSSPSYPKNPPIKQCWFLATNRTISSPAFPNSTCQRKAPCRNCITYIAQSAQSQPILISGEIGI